MSEQVDLAGREPVKWCSECRQLKPWSDFYNRKGRKFGLSSICKICSDKRVAEWNEKNPVKKRQSKRRYLNKLRSRVFEKLGGAVCVICSYDENIDALEVDHIYDDGYLEASSPQLYNNIMRLSDIEARDRYQVLCANCNRIKATEKIRRDAEARSEGLEG